MHISDGVLPAQTWIGGYVVTGAITALCLRRSKAENIPKISVITAMFFVASLIHVPLGPTSVHLILNGLAGIVLGWAAYPSILVGLTLQALLFQHGGITTIGINTVNMGLPALVAYPLFGLRRRFPIRQGELVFGALAGFEGVLLGAVLLSLSLWTAGSEFSGVAKIAFLAHIPIMVIEAVICGVAAAFLKRVKPEVLEC